MTATLALLLVLNTLTLGQSAAAPPIDGNWIGNLLSAERGQMEFALQVRSEKGKTTGVIKTAHGDWRVTSVTEKDGTYTIAFETPDGAGTLVGRISGTAFSGQFKNPMASGTFELVRSKKPV